jgi:hypothetical protein
MPLAAAVSVVDCELVRGAWPAQPANTLTSLGPVVLGAVLVTRGATASARWVGAAAVLAGTGSVLFHGELTSVTHWIHDWALLVLVAVLALTTGRRDLTTGPRVIAAAVLAGAVRSSGAAITEAVTLALVGVAAVRELGALGDRRSRPLLLAVLALGAGAVLTVLGRTDGPWCVPSSPMQPHGVWHLLTAGALGWYALARGWIGAAPLAAARQEEAA